MEEQKICFKVHDRILNIYFQIFADVQLIAANQPIVTGGLNYSILYHIDVFGLLPATRGNVPERTRMTAKIQPSGQRRERGTEDRENGVGGKIVPAQLITRREDRGKSIHAQLSTPLPPPPPPIHLPMARGEGRGQPAVDPWTRGGGRGGSQPAGSVIFFITLFFIIIFFITFFS